MVIYMKVDAPGKPRGTRQKVTRWVGNNFVSRRLAYWVADTPGESPSNYPQYCRLPEHLRQEGQAPAVNQRSQNRRRFSR